MTTVQPGSQCRRDLSGDHRVWEIPRCDDGADADGFLYHHDAAPGCRRRDSAAADPAGLFGKPFDEGIAIGDFATRFGKRLSLFERQDACQIFRVLDKQR
jgi:hypothetical protein